MDTEIFVNSVNRKRKSDGFVKYFFTNRRCAATFCRARSLATLPTTKISEKGDEIFSEELNLFFLVPHGAQGYFGIVMLKRQRRSQM